MSLPRPLPLAYKFDGKTCQDFFLYSICLKILAIASLVGILISLLCHSYTFGVSRKLVESIKEALCSSIKKFETICFRQFGCKYPEVKVVNF